MANQKVASIASQAAESHMNHLIDTIQSSDAIVETTVYYSTFHTLLRECAITTGDFKQRIARYVDKHYRDKDPKGIVGNLIKEADNPNMGQKIFSKLVKATFSE